MGEGGQEVKKRDPGPSHAKSLYLECEQKERREKNSQI